MNNWMEERIEGIGGENKKSASAYPIKGNFLSFDGGDLYSHFSKTLKLFGNVPIYRVDNWNIPQSEWPLERIVRLEGSPSFTCVLRTDHRLKETMAHMAVSDEIQSAAYWLDRLILEFAQRLALTLYKSLPVKNGAFSMRPSDPKYWPIRKPEAMCRLLAGVSPMEIRFWSSSLDGVN